MSSIAGSVKKRRKKRVNIINRLHELQYDTSVNRVRIMNEEFGPYWYFYLAYDGSIPEYLKNQPRYQAWTISINPRNQGANNVLR